MANVLATIKNYFLSGVVVVVPLILTYLVLKFLFEAVDGILQPVLHRIFGYFVPGLGVVTTILLIVLAGILTRNVIGAWLYRLGDRMLVRMPVIRPIYSSAKQLLQAMAGESMRSFKKVALIQYPRTGLWALCFESNRLEIDVDGNRRRCVTVFVPSTPTPLTGFVVVVPEDDVYWLEMTVEEALQFLVSGGVASSELLQRQGGTNHTEQEGKVGETR